MPADDAERAADARRDAPDPGGSRISAFLYDGKGADREVDPGEFPVERLPEDALLWIDVDTGRDGALEEAASLLPLPESALSRLPDDRPSVRDYGDAFVLGVLPLGEDTGSSAAQALRCAVGRNWLLTAHRGDVGSVREFADHLRGDSTLGRLDAPSFLAQLLEWVVAAYFDRLDELQQTIDEIEEGSFRLQGDPPIERLVALRHDLGQLRRRLSPHRQVLVTLAHPSFDVISQSEAAREFEVLVDRLETAVQTVDTTREMIVGAFDVFMTRTAQRTNEVMRVLTTVSVALLPATLIAGIFGMNMLPKYALHSWVFWLALLLMFVISGLLLFSVRVLFRRS